MASYKKLDSKCNKAPLLTAVSMGFSISSSSEDNVASAILFTHSPQATPTSFPGLFPRREGCPPRPAPPREGKSLGNEVEATGNRHPNSVLVINYHVHMIPIERVKIYMTCTRKMFRTLTKGISTCLF